MISQCQSLNTPGNGRPVNHECQRCLLIGTKYKPKNASGSYGGYLRCPRFFVNPNLLYFMRLIMYRFLHFQKKIPMIVTLHDIIPITNPEFCRYRDAIACQFLIRHAIRKAAGIITDSHYSAEQIVTRFPQVQSKLNIIYPGIDHDRFTPAINRNELAQQLLRQFRLYSPHFLLCVTTLNPRRNLVRLIQAFSTYLQSSKDTDICFVIAGCRGWKDHTIFKTIEQLNLETRIHFLQEISDNDIVRLNQAALAAINGSLLEGFGFPVLESMACGTPVICSSTTSLGEISGGAALPIDPTDKTTIVEAIHTIVQNQSIWNDLSKRGLERSKNFTWEKTARATYKVYEDCL